MSDLPPEFWALNRAREATNDMYAVRGFLPLHSEAALEMLRSMETQIQNTIRLVEGDPNAPWDYVTERYRKE